MAYFYKVVAEEACKCSCKFTCKGCLHLVMGKGDQPNEDVCTEKKKFIIIIWKYFQPNINLILEYSVVDKIRLDCNVFPSFLHARLLHI